MGIFSGGLQSRVLDPAGILSDPEETPAPQMSAEETALLQKQLELLEQQSQMSGLMMPYQLEQMGLIQETNEAGETTLRRMTEDERLSGMTEAGRTRYETDIMLAERQQKALRGELELPVGTEQALAKSREMQEQGLAQQLGPQWRRSTAGAQTESEIGTGEAAITDAFRRGESGLAMGLMSQNLSNMRGGTAQQAGMMGAFPGRNAGLMSGYAAASQPYANYNMAGYQNTLLNQSRQDSSDMWLKNMIGNAGSTVAGYYTGGLLGGGGGGGGGGGYSGGGGGSLYGNAPQFNYGY